MTTISSLTDLPPPFIFLFSLDNDRDEIEKYSNALRESQSKNEKKIETLLTLKFMIFLRFPIIWVEENKRERRQKKLVHKFSFYDCMFFFFVNEFNIHKFVIYYAKCHLIYLFNDGDNRLLWRERKIFRFDNYSSSQFYRNISCRYCWLLRLYTLLTLRGKRRRKKKYK